MSLHVMWQIVVTVCAAMYTCLCVSLATAFGCGGVCSGIIQSRFFMVCACFLFKRYVYASAASDSASCLIFVAVCVGQHVTVCMAMRQ